MKKFNRKETYYKITNEAENHNGLQYHTGRVVDILPFNDNTKKSCVPGGIYFTDKDHILEFGGYGPWVRPLTIPEGVKVIKNGNKFRAHEVEMQERIPLEEFVKTVNMKKQGDVDLRSLTTLPEGVKFENQGDVYLGSLTTLPEGVKFENQGYVDLCRLTTLPEGVKFENRGYVDLCRLTTLPEGVKFENRGNVNLCRLTTLPEGVKFENRGNVYLDSLTTLSDVRFENQGCVYLPRLTTIQDSVSFGEGVTKVWMSGEITGEELSRRSKKYPHVEFMR